jgi:hypothetical protein
MQLNKSWYNHYQRAHLRLQNLSYPTTQTEEAQVRLLVVAILRFIQLRVPLLPLKPMGQSRRGVTQIMEAQVHPLLALSEGASAPTEPLPHVAIVPSALMTAKATPFE